MHLILVHQKTNFPFVFDDAERLGVELTLAHDPKDVPPPRLPAVRRTLPLSLEDERAAIDTLKRYRCEIGFDGLLTLWEGAVPFIARAAREMGLPGVDPAAATLTRDKLAVLRTLREAGLNHPRWVRWRVGQPLDGLEVLTLPVVIKPAAGFGSMGVVRADSWADLERRLGEVGRICSGRLSRWQHGAEVIIEEYVDGPEYVAETYAVDGRVHVLSIGYKGEPRGPYFEESVYVAQAPLPESLARAIREQVARATLALGVRSGPTHTELRLRGGTDPFVLDVGARMGGSGAVADMVRMSTGVDLARVVFDGAAGRLAEADLAPPKSPQSVAVFYIVPVGSGGILDRIDGLEEARRHPATRRFVQFTRSGGRLAPYPDFSGYVGMVYAQLDSHSEAERYLDWARQKLQARYAPEVAA